MKDLNIAEPQTKTKIVFRIPKISYRKFLTVFPDSQPQIGKNQLANKIPPFTFIATLGDILLWMA